MQNSVLFVIRGMTRLFFLILFVWMAGCKETTTGTSVFDEDALKERIFEVAKNNHLPTLSVVIKQGDRTIDYHFQNEDANIRPIQRYGIASTTKLLTTVIVMNAIENGRLTLEDSLHSFMDSSLLKGIPWFKDITVQHLLSNTSGIPDYTQNPKWMQSVVADNGPQTIHEKLALVSDSTDNGTFGFFQYSNTNYVLLEEIIGVVYGKNAQSVFNEYFETMGFSSLSFDEIGEETQAFFAQEKNQISEVTTLNEYYGFEGGAFANAQDISKLLEELFISKSLLSEQSLNRMTDWVAMKDFTIDYRVGKVEKYGLGLMRLTIGNRTFLGHAGSSLKYQSFAFIEPETGDQIVMMTNGSGPYYNHAFFITLLGIIVES